MTGFYKEIKDKDGNVIGCEGVAFTIPAGFFGTEQTVFLSEKQRADLDKIRSLPRHSKTTSTTYSIVDDNK